MRNLEVATLLPSSLPWCMMAAHRSSDQAVVWHQDPLARGISTEDRGGGGIGNGARNPRGAWPESVSQSEFGREWAPPALLDATEADFAPSPQTALAALSLAQLRG